MSNPFEAILKEANRKRQVRDRLTEIEKDMRWQETLAAAREADLLMDRRRSGNEDFQQRVADNRLAKARG